MSEGISDTSRFLTLDRAADYLGLSPRTLRAWRSRGEGPPTAILGGRIYYRVADLEEYIDALFAQ